MAQAARAYTQPQRRVREPERPPLRVLPGNGTKARPQQQTMPYARALLGIFLVSVLFVCVVCGVRIAVATATVQTLMSSDAITQSLGEARAAGLELEVRYSVAANPNHIQEAAAQQLGMAPAEQVSYLFAEVSAPSAASGASGDGAVAGQDASSPVRTLTQQVLLAAQGVRSLHTAPAQ
ncbi:MAG: hypothetical protein LBS58_02755 [Coriobacteriales bacterium]|nr:hypothetical protein [Coriobacteriales bacterium]